MSGSKHKVSLMLDSGAYSAWTRRQELVLEDYIDFTLARQHLVDGVVVLDTIPGEPGKRRSKVEVDLAAEESHENLGRMKDAGIPAIPVFHQGESFDWLIRYIEEGNPYIGISPSGDIIKFNTDWLDQCFYYCTNSKGEPIVKTHGFGVASPTALVRYPWYSADSATYAIKSGYGSLLIPQYTGDPREGGVPNYAVDPLSVWVTGQTRETDRADYQTFGEFKKACVDDFLAKEVGVDITIMMYHPHERMRAVLVYYQRLQELLTYSTFSGGGGIGSKAKPRANAKGLKWDRKKIITAVGTLAAPARADLMNRAGVYNRLASYWEIRDLPVEELERYVTDGMLEPYVQKHPGRTWGSVSYENYRKLRLWDRIKNYKVRTANEALGTS